MRYRKPWWHLEQLCPVNNVSRTTPVSVVTANPPHLIRLCSRCATSQLGSASGQ